MLSKAYIINFITQVLHQPYKEYEHWVMTSCPFAPYTHAKKRDRRYSFGISVDGYYHCFTCGMKGNLKSLSKALSQFSQILAHNIEVYLSNVDEVFSYFSIQHQSKPITFPLDKYPYADEVMSLTKQDIFKFNVRQHKDYLIFPVYDYNWNLTGIKFRKINSKQQYVEGDIKHVLYGEHLYWHRPYLVITEGERDVILGSRYFPCVGTLGAPSRQQIQRLQQYQGKIYLAFDNDTAGQQFTQKLQLLLTSTPISVILLPMKDLAEVVEKNLVKEVCHVVYQR